MSRSRLRPDTVVLAGTGLPALVWRLGTPLRSCASTVVGGGIGAREWVVNAQVPSDYHHPDPAAHLGDLARRHGLTGPGVGFLTAADVTSVRHRAEAGVEVWGTLGVERPVWASAPSGEEADRDGALTPGTINLVVAVPASLSDAALVNAVATATEAKAQALREIDFPGTGTASDAVCVLAPDGGRPELYGGPRSTWGARVARAVHDVVLGGAQAARRRSTPAD